MKRKVSDMVKIEDIEVRVDLYEHPMVDVAIGSIDDCFKFAEMVIKKHSNFTDGGTPKKQVHIKISDIKRSKFIHSLCASTRDRKSISDRDFDEASFRWYDDEDDTHCIMKLHDLEVVGITRKHPDDTPNEYIGKSLSFNRAFDKLEDAVNGVADKTCVGIALHDACAGCWVTVGSVGMVTQCRAGVDIKKGADICNGNNGRVYPKKSERPFYHGGIVNGSSSGTAASSNIENGTIVYGHVFLDGEWKWMYTPKTETKSECTDKESDDITITMNREQGEEALKTLQENPGNIDTYWNLFHALGV